MSKRPKVPNSDFQACHVFNVKCLIVRLSEEQIPGIPSYSAAGWIVWVDCRPGLITRFVCTSRTQQGAESKSTHQGAVQVAEG